ncbi:N-alpha-acetyltransferase 60 [Trichinella spiralis]|uniref:N-alpha-acetyltransferase 60 n=1 Tax=Trichinella spiralis TaxID=6334 RepID=A0A0V1BPB0_TRISP|nr:N-alpha-acetyltransferase 60 [Trichinella spiralis]
MLYRQGALGSTSDNNNTMEIKSELIKYTDMRVEHFADVVDLFEQCFPVSYSISWMWTITNDKKYWKMVATYEGKVVGVLWAIVDNLEELNKQHYDTIMIEFLPAEMFCCYILNIAVSGEFRRHKIATNLLKLLYKSFTSSKKRVDAVFLHVMVDNKPAMKFYEKMHFQKFILIPHYYTIDKSGKNVDAWIYMSTFQQMNIFKKLFNTTVSFFYKLTNLQ